MTQTVSQDLLLVLTIIGLGAGIGFFFDCYRLLRRKTKPSYFFTQLSDLLFWLICAGLIFYVFFWLTGGEIRFLTLLFLPAGMALYFKFASPYLREPLYFCFLQIGCGLRFLLSVLIFGLHVLLYPFRLAVWVINFALQFLCGLFRLLLLPFRYSWRVVWRQIREWWRRRK